MLNKLFALFFVLISTNLFAGDCTHLIGTCEYYLCREKVHSCGPKGYYLGFAYKYCMKSEEILSKKMDAPGKKWIKEVATCLQESVDRMPDQESCATVKKLAIADHNVCYVQAGFCSLKTSDRLHIVNMLKKELYHRSILHEGLEVLRQCASN